MQHNTKSYTKKPKLFIIADAGVDTGFAQVTHNLVEHLHLRYEVHIMGINYYGDPHPIQSKAKLYNPSARAQGDYYGTARVKELLRSIEPDIVFLINDPWVAASYVPLLKGYKGAKVLYTPIDGTNIKNDFITPLNDFTHIVGYTQFGVTELLKGGLTVETSVIPHGVNTKLYKPIDMKEAREKNGFPMDWFIVNITDRNQIRKRIDLGFYYFSEWVKRTGKTADQVKLHYHGAMEDEGWDLFQLADALGIHDYFIITAPNITAANGLPLELMPYVYAPANVGLSTTMGEGWGLTTHERMAMRVPMIVPKYSALGEWANGGVHYTEISNIPYFNTKALNTKGGIATLESTVDALETMYVDAAYRQHVAEAGYKLATSAKFNWRNIAQQFDLVFRTAIKKEQDNAIRDSEADRES